MTDHPLLEAALGYAARGWPVFPCNAATKAPLVKGDVDAEGKAIRNTGGVKKATCDAAQITAWWTRWPNAMIGVAMGSDAGVFAIDFDPRVDAVTGEVWTLERLRGELEAQIGVGLPVSATQITPSGGVHLFLAWPTEGDPIVNRGNLPDHVDVRGQGGYVCVAPSVRHDGTAYRWRRSIDDTPVAAAPPELLAVLRDRKGKAAAEQLDTATGVAAPVRRISDASEAIRKYALSAFDAECQAVRGAADGTRSDQLNRSAFALGSLVGAGVLDESTVRAALEGVARDWPNFPKSQGTIASGLAAGMDSPRDLSAVAAAAAEREQRYGPPRARQARRSAPSGAEPANDVAPSGAASSAPASSPSAPVPPIEGEQTVGSQSGGRRPQRPAKGAGDFDASGAYLPQTDLGNAERWFMRYGDSFRWCSALGWLAWDGRRWKPSSSDVAPPELAISVYATVRAIADEADWRAKRGEEWRDAACIGSMKEEVEAPDPANPDPVIDLAKKQRASDKLRGWGRASESSGHLSCIANLARPWCAVDEGLFDADPLMINVGNGTLVLSREIADGFTMGKVELKPHDRDDFITKLANVDYDPAASAPVYDRFLLRVQPDAALRRFLHAWGGYSLTGDVSAQKLVFNYGMGANGKSTWVDAIADAAGDYGRSVGIETFLDQGTKRKGGDATPDLANLKGVRLVRTSEPERGAKFAEALIKLATGGEPISVRHNYGTFFDLNVQFKLTISGNHRPEIGTDEGIWRRMQLVPWAVTIPEGERDADLAKKLKTEAPGILNRLIAGAIDWLEAGLPATDAVLEATREYREASDPLGRFLAAAIVNVQGNREQSSKVHSVFVAWCRQAGEKEWSARGLSKALSDRGYRKVKSSFEFWEGMQLVKFEHDFVDATGKAREVSEPDWRSYVPDD